MQGEEFFCLSDVTQKKNITPKEEEIIKKYGSVWGCDICQTVCPENSFRETPIDFFKKDRVENLTRDTVEKQLSEGTFKSRAYAWRGEKVVLRNIDLTQKE